MEPTFINASRLSIAEYNRRRRDWWRSLRRSRLMPPTWRIAAELRTVLGPVYLGEGLEFYFVNHGPTCGAEFFLNLAPTCDRHAVWSEILTARSRLEAAFGGPLEFEEFAVRAYLTGGSYARKTCWPAIQTRQIDVMSRLLRAVDQVLPRLTDPMIDEEAASGWETRQDHWRNVAERDGVMCAYLEAQLAAIDQELERRRHLN